MLLSAISWIGGASGFWDDPTNWSLNREPNGNDDVTINVPNITVTIRDHTGALSLQSSANIAVTSSGSLFVQATSVVSGNLSLAGEINGESNFLTLTGTASQWTAGGEIDGIVTNAGILTLSDTGAKYLGGRLINSGTMHQSGGNLLFNGSTSLENDGLYDLTDDSGLALSGFGGGGYPLVNNTGIFRKSGGSGTSNILVEFDGNGGTIDAESGRLLLSARGSLQGGGAWNAGTGAVLAFQPGFNSFQVDGTFTGSGGGQVQWLGGDFQAVNLAQNAPVFNFPQGLFQWQGGELDNSISLNNTGYITLSGTSGKDLGGQFINNGTIQQSGGDLLFNGSSSLKNFGVYDLTDDSGFGLSGISGGGYPLFNNLGTLEKSAGVGTSTIIVEVDGTASTIAAESGTLFLSGRGTFQGGGTWNASTGAVLEFNPSFNSIVFDGTFTGGGGGEIHWAGNEFTPTNLQDNTPAAFNFPEGMFHWQAGQFDGNLPLTNLGFMTLDTAGTKYIYRDTLLNLGTIIDNGPGDFILHGNGDFLGCTIDNQTGGTFILAGDLNIPEGGSFMNEGLLEKTAGTGVAKIDAKLIDATSGQVSVQSGTLKFTQGSVGTSNTFDVASNAVLEFTGSSFLDWNGTFSSTGAGVIKMETGLSSDSYQAPAILNFAAGKFVIADDDGVPSFGGAITNNGQITFANSGDLFVRALVVNNGTITHTGAGNFRLNGNTSMVNNGLYDLQSDADIFVPQDGSFGFVHFVNAGTLRKSAGTGISQLRGDNPNSDELILDNTGTVEVDSGTLDIHYQALQLSGSTLTAGNWIVKTGGTLLFPGGASIGTNQAAITLDGAGASLPALGALQTNQGTLSLRHGIGLTTGNLTNAGMIALGSGTRLGVNGNLTFTSAATLSVEVGGTPGRFAYGRIVTTGLTTLNGTLNATIAAGFAPTAAQLYPIVTSGTVSGAFSSIVLPGLLTAATTSTTVQLQGLGDPADLEVSSITIPSAGSAGRQVSISYTVENTGASAAGSWVDSVFLSSDSTLSANDVLIGRVTHTGGVAASGSYSETLSAALPAVAEGSYHILVEADSQLLVADSDRSNNIGASTASIATTLASLAPGVPVTGTLAAGQDIYYGITLQAGQDVVLTPTLGVNAEAEIFARYNALPTTGTYDSFASPFGSNLVSSTPKIYIHAAQTGRYFVLLHGLDAAGSGQAFTLTPALADFGATSISPGFGGNSGTATVTISGADFSPNSNASLVLGGTTRAAGSVTFVSANELFATFDLTGLATGNYDLKVADGSSTATLPAAFAVSSGSPGQLSYHLGVPQLIHQGGTGTVTIDYTNTGGGDLPAPLFVVTSNNASFRLPDQTGFVPDAIEVLGINRNGPAGLLGPGQSGSVTVLFQQNNTASEASSTFNAFVMKDSTTIDWASMKDSLRPVSEPADAWNAIYANFTTMIGTTAGQYESVLRRNATYLSTLGTYTDDPQSLLSFELQQADDLGNISQRYKQTAFGRGQSDTIHLSAQTDSNGNVAVTAGGTVQYYLRQADGSYAGIGGNPLTLTHALGGAYTLTAPSGAITTFLPNGQLNYYQDTNASRITAHYTGTLLTSLITSTGDATFYAYNSQGLVTKITDPVGRITTYTYSSAGDLLTVTTPQGVTRFTYVGGSNPALQHTVASIANPDGTQVFYSYDTLGRVILETGAGGANPIHVTYDAVGNPTTNDASGSTLGILINQLGQVAAAQLPAQFTVGFAYNASSGGAAVTLPGGLTQSTLRDANGNLTQVTTPSGQVIRMTYDPAHNRLASMTDAMGNTTTFGYDANGNQISLTNAANNTTSLTRNSLGELVSGQTAGGRGVVNTYDSNNLLVRQDFSDNTHVVYTYDAHRNLLTATDASGTVTYAYDASDRRTKITYPNGLFLAYTYDASGRMSQTVDQSGFTTNYLYDAQGRFFKTTDGTGALIAMYTYDSSNRVSRTDYGNGTFTTYAYNVMGATISVINHQQNGSVISSFAYAYDALGHVTSVNSTAGTTTYTYDLAGNLTQAVLPGGRTISYFYDANGNRTSAADSGATTDSYASNDLNQYTAIGATTYTYDADGNLLTSSNTSGTTTYAYNVRNQLVSVATPAHTITYHYDALGHRITSTLDGVTTKFLIDPTGIGNVVGQFTSAGAVISHNTYGIGLTSQIDSSNQASYYNFDAAGNTSELTGNNGAVLNTYSYLPFGEVAGATGSTANPYTFSGQSGVMADPSGLYYMRARYYAANTGQFTQMDPTGFSGGDMNLYRYASNNPLTFSDPTGKAWGVTNLSAEAERAFHAVYGHFPATSADAETAIDMQIQARYQQRLAENEAEKAAAQQEAEQSAAQGSGETAAETGAESSADTAANTAADTAVDGLADTAVDSAVSDAVTTTATDLAATTGEVVASAAPEAVSGSSLLALSPWVAAAAVPLSGAAFFGLAYVGAKGYAAGPEGIPVPAQDSLNPDAFNRASRHPLVNELIRKARANGQEPDPDVIAFYVKLQSDYDHAANTKNGVSGDPNDIIGPAGFGANGYIAPNQALPYHIDFENHNDATAPAQIVTITENLDSHLDWSTFALGDIGFGGTTIAVPAGLQNFTSHIDLGGSLRLDIAAAFNPASGVITWTFTTIDTTTGDIPGDASLGFLPPDVTPPQGQGFVNYTVLAKAALTTADPIHAQANIVFDQNPVIPTPNLLNTIDSIAPVSSVGALPRRETGAQFAVTWSGTDDAGGSGIAGYNVFVSDNGGTFTQWLTGTTATTGTYYGTAGHSYAFYSVAVDNVGNVEAAHTASDAITIAGIVPGVYSNLDLTGPFALGGLHQAGGLTADGAGAFTTGSWTNENSGGTTDVVAGSASTYTVSAGGLVTASLTTEPHGTSTLSLTTLSGAINATRDIAALAGTNSLDVLVAHAGTFTLPDMAGTWALEGQNYHGTVTLNASGSVLTGSITLKSGQSAAILSGSVTVNADGTGTLSLATKFVAPLAAYTSIALAFTLDSSKNVAVANNANCATQDAQLTLLVKNSAGRVAADLPGTWTFTGASGMGTFNIGAGNKITGTFTDNNGSTSTLSGSASVTAAGAVTLTVGFKIGAVTTSETFSGQLNASRNLMAFTRSNALSAATAADLGVLINSANHAPVVPASATLPITAFQASAFTIPFATIATALGATDADGDALSYRITAAPTSAGTLAITHAGGTSLVLPGTTTLVAGDALVWTPAARASGNVNVFSLQALDGATASAKSASILIKTMPLPTVTPAATVASAEEFLAGTTAANGTITLKRSGGVIAQPLTVTLNIGGTAQLGTNYTLLAPDGSVISTASPTVTFAANQASIALTVVPRQDFTADPTLTVLVTVTADPSVTSPLYLPASKPSAQVSVFDSNPIVKITAASAATKEGSPAKFTLTRTPPRGGNANSGFYVSFNYTQSTFSNAHFSGPPYVFFSAGQTSQAITVNTTRDGVANPTRSLVVQLTGSGFVPDGTGQSSTGILDTSSTISVTASKASASEVNGTTTGAGTFAFTRTGGDMSAPLTVNFSVGSSATEGTDYTALPSHTVSFAANKSTAIVTINPRDDVLTEGPETVVLAVAANGGPTYFIAASPKNTATVTIADDTRPIILTQALPLGPTAANTPLSISYNDLRNTTGAMDRAGAPISFKITAVSSGSLTLNGAPVAVNTLLTATQSLVWTPSHNVTGTLTGFSILATDGTNATVTTAIQIQVT